MYCSKILELSGGNILKISQGDAWHRSSSVAAINENRCCGYGSLQKRENFTTESPINNNFYFRSDEENKLSS